MLSGFFGLYNIELGRFVFIPDIYYYIVSDKHLDSCPSAFLSIPTTTAIEDPPVRSAFRVGGAS